MSDNPFPGTPRPSGKKKKILFLTGTRADFGKLKPLMREVSEAPDFDIAVFATGMHMLARYGETVIEIRKSGFHPIQTFVNQDEGGTPMDLILARTVEGLGRYVRESPPDLLVVHGDRIEAMAGAIVGVLQNILVAHVEGGEISGTVDELLRHAVSKLAHLHFVSNETARGRLIQMGELASSVYVIGNPSIDVMLSDDLPPLEEVLDRYGIPWSEYGILLYHPVTNERDSIGAQAGEVIEAAKRSGLNFVVIQPNNDPGTECIRRALEQLSDIAAFRVLPSMRFEFYLTLLKNSRVLLGNSSSGIHEAPVLGVPTLNIGTRQDNRFQYPSIQNLDPDSNQILRALLTLPENPEPSLQFGTGDSAPRFMESLRSKGLWATSRQKQFRDLPGVSRPL